MNFSHCSIETDLTQQLSCKKLKSAHSRMQVFQIDQVDVQRTRHPLQSMRGLIPAKEITQKSHGSV